MNPRAPGPANETVADQAVRWFILNREGPLDDASKVEFLSWMKCSPEHVREYLRALHIHGQVGAAVASLRYDARGVDGLSEPSGKVVSLFADAPPRTEPAVRRLPRWWRALAVAACLVVALWVVVPVMRPAESMLISGHGELREFELPDHTKVRLNADSRVRIRMWWWSRQVELLRGEATFDVGKSWRRFEVRVPGLRIRDIGTRFDVSRRLQGTRIGVVSGEVEVWGDGADKSRLAQLGAGRVVQIDDGSHAVRDLDLPVSMLLDWQQRKISFRDERLDEVAREFNRYNQMQIVIEDEAAASMRLSGSLDADRIAALQGYLKRDPRFLIRQDQGTVRISSR